MDFKLVFKDGEVIEVISKDKPSCSNKNCDYGAWLCKLSASIGAKAIVKKMRGMFVEVQWLDELSNEQTDGMYCAKHFKSANQYRDN
jgi:hypothetical protein